MPASNRDSRQYFTVLEGKFTQRVSEHTQGAVARINKQGKQVHELYFSNFNGRLSNIEFKDSQYGETLNLIFGDEVVQFSVNSGLATSFLKMLPNINTQDEIELSISTKEEKGKPKTSLFVRQNGGNVKYAHTRENPNGMPDLEKIIFKGKEEWDNTKQLAFFKELVEVLYPKSNSGSSSQSEAYGADGEVIDVDDI